MSAETFFWRSIGSVVLAMCATLWLPQASYADSAPRWTDAQLAGFSDVILRGHVTRIAVARDDLVGALYTYVSVDVAEVLKGSTPDPQITLKQLGGRLGSDALRIGGQATFVVGEDVLVFLEERPRDHTLTTTALWQGKFTIVSTAAGDTVVRQDPGGPARGMFSDQTRALEPWVRMLRREVADGPARAPVNRQVAPRAAVDATIAADPPPQSNGPWWNAAMARESVRVDSVAPGQPQLADRGERQLRAASDFWSSTGIATLAPGGLQPSGCFTAREPDGRIAVGVDGCEELNPSGGTIAVGGTWVRYETDTGNGATPRFLGGGVITSRGGAAARLLAQPGCFEQVARHELGHAIGLTDSQDGGGVMAPILHCDPLGTFAAPLAPMTAATDMRPTFVPLQSHGPASTTSEGPKAVSGNTCIVGCKLSEATFSWAPPPAPTNLTYTLVGSTLTLNWLPGSGGGLTYAYVIEAGSSSGGTDVANFSTGSIDTSFSATVSGNAVFYIRVRAANVLTSAPSNEVVVVVGGATVAPGPPGGLTASAAGASVTLGWNAPATGGPVASYVIQAGSTPGATDLANFSTGNTATTFSAAGVSPGTYFVRVRASNAGGTGAPSNEILLLVGPGCAAPGAPSNLAAAVSGSTVTLMWNAGAGASSYQLHVGSSSGRSDLLDVDLLSPSTTLTAANVGAGLYFVRVRSINACGQGGASNEALIVIR